MGTDYSVPAENRGFCGNAWRGQSGLSPSSTSFWTIILNMNDERRTTGVSI